MIQNRPSISVFFPAYNDEGSIERMVRDALVVLPTLTDDYEVIVVNDGSRDTTSSVLDEMAAKLSFVKVIHHQINQGYGAALRTGFRHAAKDLIFYTDGDGQYDARELAALVPLLTPDVDIVNGYKLKRADNRRRRLLGSIYNRLARLLFRLPIRDVDCDFRLIRRSRIEQVQLVSSSGVICTEMVRKLHAAGCTFAEVPIHHYPRAHGESQFFTLRSVARTASDFFLLWWKIVIIEPLLPARPAFEEIDIQTAMVAEQVQSSSE